MDIIERLNDPALYVDAVNDAIHEIERLRAELLEVRVELSNALAGAELFVAANVQLAAVLVMAAEGIGKGSPGLDEADVNGEGLGC